MLSISLAGLAGVSPANAVSPAAVNLGSSASFAVLAATYATTGAPSTFKGNVAAGAAITTGASNTIVGSMYSGQATTVGASSSISGNLYAGAAITLGAGSTVSGSQFLSTASQYSDATNLYTSAMSSMNTAITDINNRTATPITGLAGATLTAGVYSSVASLDLSGTLTLDAQGDPNAVFIIKSASYLVTAASSTVVLINDAQAKNVFWAPQGYFTAGASSVFKGNVLATSYISIGASTAIEGRLFSQTSYVLFGTGNADSVFGITGIGTTEIATAGAALTPTFGTPTATAGGFTVQISNFSGDYVWAGTATAGGSVVVDGTGLVTVSGVAANTASTATITTTRSGYTGGTANVNATSIAATAGAALTPTFGTPTATAGGYTVQISNFSGDYVWAGTATAGGSVVVSGSGLVTVSGVAANTASTATITTTRSGYTGGTATVNATSTPAYTPTSGTPTLLKTVEFTDTTLSEGTKGQVYRDVVAARTLLDGTANSQTVTYSVSPSLADLGLSMDTAGVITGTVSTVATAGTYSFTVTASSAGYAAQIFVYSLVIKAAQAVPPAPSYKTVKFRVYFNGDSSQLRVAQKASIVHFLGALGKKVVGGSVDGYVRRSKSQSKDTALSIARARAVAKFLSSKRVKAPLQITGKGILNSSNLARVVIVTLRYKN